MCNNLQRHSTGFSTSHSPVLSSDWPASHYLCLRDNMGLRYLYLTFTIFITFLLRLLPCCRVYILVFCLSEDLVNSADVVHLNGNTSVLLNMVSHLISAHALCIFLFIHSLFLVGSWINFFIFSVLAVWRCQWFFLFCFSQCVFYLEDRLLLLVNSIRRLFRIRLCIRRLKKAGRQRTARWPASNRKCLLYILLPLRQKPTGAGLIASCLSG